MRRIVVAPLAIVIIAITSSTVAAQKAGTLYSPNIYGNEPRDFCLNFKSGLSRSLAEPCDLRYGLLGINNDFDWFQISMSRDSRGVIKDLGSYTWTDKFEVPVLTPLPKLGPSQQRSVSIDVSGADGAPGAPGTSFSPGTPVPVRGSVERNVTTPSIVANQPGNDGKPKIDPAFVKAIAGHIYAIRVVDEKSDYYALVRVDSVGGGTCAISWKLVPSPKE